MNNIKAKNVVLSNGMNVEDMVNLIAKFATESKTTPFNQIICETYAHGFGGEGLVIPYDNNRRLGCVSDNFYVEDGKYVIVPETESVFNAIQISGVLQIETSNQTANPVAKRIQLVPRYYGRDDLNYENPTAISSIQHEKNLEIPAQSIRQYQMPFFFNIFLNTKLARAFELHISTGGADVANVTFKTVRRSFIKYEGISTEFN